MTRQNAARQNHAPQVALLDDLIESIHHYDLRHLRTYNDYMQVYGNEVKAKILRILESWTNTHKVGWHKAQADARERHDPVEAVEPDYWITMSHRQFKIEMYDAVSEDTIKKYLEELETSGDIARRVHPEYPYGPPQYRLNADIVQKKLYDSYTKTHAGWVVFPTPPEISPPPGKTLPGGPKTDPRGGGKSHTPPAENDPQGGGKTDPSPGGKFPPLLRISNKNQSKLPKNQGDHVDVDHDEETESSSNDSSPSFPSTSDSFPDDSDASEDDTPTEESPAIRRSAAATATLTPPALTEARIAPPLRASEQRIARYKAIYVLASREYGAKLLPTPDNEAGAKLLVESDLSDEQIATTIRGILDDPDPFWANQFSLLVVAKRVSVYCRAQPVGAAKASNGKRASPALHSAAPPANAARGDTWRAPSGEMQVFWDNQWMSVEDADAVGYNGGFGLYN